MGRVAGKVALVAGAGGGIGGAGAEGLGPRRRSGVLRRHRRRRGRGDRRPHPRRRRASRRARLSTCATARRSMRRLPRRCANSAGSICCSNAPASANRLNFLDLDRRDLGPHHRGQSDRHVSSGAGGGAADGEARRAAAASSMSPRSSPRWRGPSAPPMSPRRAAAGR